MAEKVERDEVFAELKKSLKCMFPHDYFIRDKENLLKTRNVCEQSETEDKKRGKNAFQTDMLISNKEDEPLVVIELKTGQNTSSPTTHDVFVYSSKAGKHKDMFPYIRYGMVWFNGNKVPNRFIFNNENMDFAFGFSNGELSIKEEKDTFCEIIKEQLKTAEDTLELWKCKGPTASFFSSTVRYNREDCVKNENMPCRTDNDAINNGRI